MKKVTMTTLKPLTVALFLGLILATSSTLAAGDAVQGQQKAYTCTGCHGITTYTNAYPNYRVPKIGGQNQAYLTAALKAYREGQRKHPTMSAQAGSMSDQDIEDITSYLSGLKKKG
jgi:cytochrome c553